MKINRKINCKNQKELQKQSIKTLLIKSIKTNKININRNIDKFIDQNQYPMLREHKFNYYQLFNIIVVSLYKMQFRPKITTKWGKKFLTKMACPTLQKYNLVTKFPDLNKSGISDHKHPQKSSCFQQTSTNIFLFSLQNVNFQYLVYRVVCPTPTNPIQ